MTAAELKLLLDAMLAQVNQMRTLIKLPPPYRGSGKDFYSYGISPR